MKAISRPAAGSIRRLATSLVAASIPLFLSLALAISCENLTEPFLETERVRVILPEAHPAWRAASPGMEASYTLRWRDASGRENALVGVEDETTLELERGAFTPIVVESESERAGIPRGILPSAGALYPVHASRSGGESIVRADWLRGVDAECAELARTGSRDGFAVGTAIAEHLNWGKFDAVVSAKDNPLLVDRRAAAEAILSGKMSVYDVAERKLVQVSARRSLTAIPGTRSFFPSWSHTGTASLATAADGSFDAALPAGVSHWFCESGILVVSVAGTRVECAFFTPYGLRE